MNKTPHVTQSDNVPPWQWKAQKSTVNKNPGPAQNVAADISDPVPYEEGRAVQTGCLQNELKASIPIAMKSPVLPLTQTEVLEDGKETQVFESRCIENSHHQLSPQSAGQNVMRQETGTVLENVKMTKGLT